MTDILEKLRALRTEYGYGEFDHAIKTLNRERLQTRDRPEREQFSKSTYSRLYQVQRGMCSICEMPMAKLLKFKGLAIDHRNPNATGADFNAWENLGLAHEKCNAEKSAKSMLQMSKETGKTMVEML